MLILKLILTSAFLFVDDAPRVDSVRHPRPIPREIQEDVSRLIIAVQEAQITKMQLQAQTDAAIKQADERVEFARRMLQQKLAPLQKELDAEGCDLSIDKTWHCPGTPPAAKRTGGN